MTTDSHDASLPASGDVFSSPHCWAEGRSWGSPWDWRRASNATQGLEGEGAPPTWATVVEGLPYRERPWRRCRPLACGTMSACASPVLPPSSPSASPSPAPRPTASSCEPGTVRFLGAGKSVQVHATPYEKTGKHIPDPPCTWTVSDEKVAKVLGRRERRHRHRGGRGHRPGPLHHRERSCRAAGAGAGHPAPRRNAERAELAVTDTPTPLQLSALAFDGTGASLALRPGLVTCAGGGLPRRRPGPDLAGRSRRDHRSIEIEGASARSR